MESISRACPRCGAAAAPSARFCPACGQALAILSVGQILDAKYEILEKIGEGGMGEVYRARHIHLDEIRIIKVTKPDSLGEGIEPRRFQAEARLATLVRHPNVAALYDFSRQPDGSYYMVWEFIDGVTLEQWLRREGPLPLPTALEVARQILTGLAEIHAQGIVHRDLSPDNIMLRTGAGGRLQAKIIDLGIAKRVTAESLQMTGTGVFVGKLKYCSPEQAGSLAPGETVDGRSDLYSFGIVLYEMLVGRTPFESPTPEGYIGQHLNTPAPPLDVARLPKSVGPALAAVVAKSLEKKRERRFRDAQEFAEALARLLPAAVDATDTAPTETAPTPPGQRARGAFWAAGTLLAAILVYGFFVLRRREEPRVAPAPPRPPTIPAAVAPPLSPAAALTPLGSSSAAPAEARHAAVGRDSGGPSAEETRARIDAWKSRPSDRRAQRAQEIARMADRFVTEHPGDPLAEDIRSRLPQLLRSEAADSLDRAQPLAALLYYRAYKQLAFAPRDPDLERRIGRLRREAAKPARRPPE